MEPLLYLRKRHEGISRVISSKTGKMWALGFLASGVLALGGHAMAQEAADFTPAFSAEDDLDCAIYVGALMAELGEEMTPDDQTGLTSAFTYFVGRYEAQRGLEITKAFTERYPLYLQGNPATIAQTCSVRMRAFGVRLNDAGRALSRLQPPRSPALQEEPAPSQPPP